MSWSNMKLFSSWEDNLPHLYIYLSIYQSTHAIISHHQNDVIKCELFWLYFSAVIGEIDEDTDSTLDLGNIRAEPLNSVVHWLRPTSTFQPRLYTTLDVFPGPHHWVSNIQYLCWSLFHYETFEDLVAFTAVLSQFGDFSPGIVRVRNCNGNRWKSASGEARSW